MLYESDKNYIWIDIKNLVDIFIYDENNNENNNNKNINNENQNLKEKFIQRQVEYYFGDFNYEKDNYIKSIEDKNGFIDINKIINFNKIKNLVKNKDEFINCLKNSQIVEFNSDYTKIKKKY
jgi:hypothetical protein